MEILFVPIHLPLVDILFKSKTIPRVSLHSNRSYRNWMGNLNSLISFVENLFLMIHDHQSLLTNYLSIFADFLENDSERFHENDVASMGWDPNVVYQLIDENYSEYIDDDYHCEISENNYKNFHLHIDLIEEWMRKLDDENNVDLTKSN